MYKIKHRDTGLYSTGSCRPGWNKNGKIWTTIGHLKAHMSQIHGKYAAEYQKCDIVTVQLTEVEGSEVPVHRMLNDIRDAKVEEERRREESRNQRVEREERAQLRKLKDKYES